MNATLEKHWFLQGFHALFSCDFINVLNQLTDLAFGKTLPARETLVLIYISSLDPFILAASPVCEACQYICDFRYDT